MPDDTKFTELAQLGFEPSQLDVLQRAVKTPSGMLLSVGPVGSGKSTTTYACLMMLNNPGRSMVSIEDPVERRIEGVNQIQTDNKIAFGFVEALRGVLRQDPNIIMVGEIRDAETAHIAARAALTGTQVLSTLHAGDTAATVDLFREFELPAMFIADSLNCVIAQRLLRKVCATERETFHPDGPTAQILGLNPDQCESIELVRGIPGPSNFNTGYMGRTGVFEIMRVDHEMRDAILHKRSNNEIRDLSKSKGMQTLEQSAINKVLAGITTVEEMHRVLLAG
jgi:type II secretory ATPase GspE/PulE/Tfp pilus assembly ATPase PilB-like protein